MGLSEQDVVREYCRISALAYHTLDDFTHANDGFCFECPYRDTPNFRNDGKIIDYVRAAVVEKLKRDGYTISQGFDQETGKEL